MLPDLQSGLNPHLCRHYERGNGKTGAANLSCLGFVDHRCASIVFMLSIFHKSNICILLEIILRPSRSANLRVFYTNEAPGDDAGIYNLMT